MTTKAPAATKATKAPAKATKATKATKAAPAPAPAAVALRGGPAVQRVTLTGKAYRTGAKHNADWWQQVQQAAAAGPATVAALVEAGVPTHFIGYTLRRGYLATA